MHLAREFTGRHSIGLGHSFPPGRTKDILFSLREGRAGKTRFAT
jgi:hypothetical protein